MAKNKFERFRNMSDNELANYYVDVCAYREIEAIEQQKAISKIMVERFIDKYADKQIEVDCDNCFFSVKGVCNRVGGCRYDN